MADEAKDQQDDRDKVENHDVPRGTLCEACRDRGCHVIPTRPQTFQALCCKANLEKALLRTQA